MLTKFMIIVTLLWAGMILGISFLDSWIKFRAPSLTKPVGLDVGRTVFNAFQKVQCGLLALLILASLATHTLLGEWIIIIILSTLLILQLTWLFPILNRHVNLIITGEKAPASYAHHLYGFFEIAKLILLINLSIGFIAN